MRNRTLFVFALIVLMTLLTSCQLEDMSTAKVLPEWSRGRPLGVAGANQPVGLWVETDAVHVIAVAEGGKNLQYTRLDGSGAVQISATIATGGTHPSYPQLLPGNGDALRLFWLDTINGPAALYSASLSADGQLENTRRLSPDDTQVSSYATAQNADGSVEAFMAVDDGLLHARLNEQGTLAGASRLLVPGAAHPALQQDQDGAIHLIWTESHATQAQVRYASFNPATDVLQEPVDICSYQTGTGSVAYPPVLGLDAERAYVFGSREQRGGGLSSGEAQTYWVSFPLNQPAAQEPALLEIPAVATPAYSPAHGELPYTRLAGAGGSSSSYLYMPAVLRGERQELGVFLAGELSTRRQSGVQVIWAIFEGGQFKGYQVPAVCGHALRPTAVLDDQGNAHLVWLQAAGFGRYTMYYGSTAAGVRAHLDRISIQDRVVGVLNAAWTLVPALGFFPPVFLLWSFPSFLWVVGFYAVRTEGALERRSAQIALTVAIALYLAVKLLVTPGVLLYAPFVNRFPPNLQFIPVLATPLLTMLAAGGSVALYFRRRPYRSLFATYLIFVLVDALLSLFIYIPGWLAG